MEEICDICKEKEHDHKIIHESILNFILEHYPELKQERRKTGRAEIRLCCDCWMKVKIGFRRNV